MTNISNLTPQERATLREEFLREEKQKTTQREKEIETYKSLVDKVVTECFPVLEVTSNQLIAQKTYVREQFSAIIELKVELYATKEDQGSHTFRSADGKRRIKIGYTLKDDYDDTVNSGIQKVKGFISSLAKDEETKALVDTVLRLLSKDKKGTLKPSRIVLLEKMAKEIGNPIFIEGIKIIIDAYAPQDSKLYIRAEYKNDIGVWCTIPLGMTEA